MIIYAVFSNEGGMKRVSEAQLQQKVRQDVLYVNFSEKECVGENLVWFEWRNVGANYTEEKCRCYHEEISKKIDMSQVKVVIGDFFTLPYFSQFPVEFIYDIHSLSLPLHAQMQKDFSYLKMDNYTKFPTSNVTRLSHIPFARLEYSLLERSIGYISNSQNTSHYLKKYYAEIIAGKPIFDVPVISFMETHQPSQSAKRFPMFAFSRWHPQKGYSLLLEHDWARAPLYIRGFSPNIFTNLATEQLKKRSITILPWTNESGILSENLGAAEVVLFPAVYEPYGLALEEALSVGALCVAHRNESGHEEQITHGVNGFLLDFRAPTFFDDLMKIYNSSTDHKNEIRTNARLKQRATLQDRDAALEKVFEWLRRNLS